MCNPLLVVASKVGNKQLVNTLRYVDQFLAKAKFKYEDIRTGLIFLKRGNFYAHLISSQGIM